MYPWADYQTQQWKYLFEITRAIAEGLDLDAVLTKALTYAVDLVGGEAGLVALRAESGDTFQFRARYGIEARLLPRFEPLLNEIPLTIARDRTPRWRFPELQLRFRGVMDESTVRLSHVMAIPLIASERLLGLIYVFRSFHAATFTAMDEDALAGFADHVAIAVENAQLYRAAEERAQELATVIQESANGILIADRALKIRSINRTLAQLTGWTRQDAQAKDYGQVLQLQDERGAPVALPLFSDAPQSVWTRDAFLKRRDGSRGAFVHLTLSPQYDEARQLFSLVANVVDVTGLKEAQDLKTTFLAGISHDLKTPLALIRGYAETLRRPDVEWDRQTMDSSLAVIEEEAEYLTSLVNALLDAAQLQRGRVSLQWTTVRLDELAKKVVERFRSTHTGHLWTVEFPPDFPAVTADAERLREVLQNLLNNAVKYSPRESLVTVGGWVEPERIGVFVRDEGPGIPTEEQARIFEPFARGRGQSVQRAQGAGLGLYLCRAIVEQHGGRIWMENLPERGAAFYFTLPRESYKLASKNPSAPT